MLILCFLPHISLASNVEDALSVGIQSTKTPSIHPLDPKERDILSVYSLIYESLVTIDDNYLPQPLLCDHWEMSTNGRTWTFYLRDNVTFSDGTPLTAYDVVATALYILDRAKDTSTEDHGYYANLQYFVREISASDAYTVVVKAERAYWGLLYAMTFPILKQSELLSDMPAGSGPYRLVGFSAGSYIALSANERWWKNQPVVKDITFTCYSTPREVIESYEYARVDTIFTRSIAAAQYRSGQTSLSLASRTRQLEVLLMNHSASKLSSVNVRKAIRAALDKDRLASSVYMGMADRTDTPWPNGTWMYDSSLSSQFLYNQEEAKRLLAEDGWGDSNQDGVLDRLNDQDERVDLTLNLYVYEEPDNDVRIEAANLIKEQLAQVGISVSISTMTFAGVREKLAAGSFNLALVSYSMDVAPDYGFMLWSGNSGNYARYRSSAMTELCRELRTCLSQGEYQAKLFEIQAQFAADCPFVCLYYREGVVLTRKMYTTARDIRELELLRGIESFSP